MYFTKRHSPRHTLFAPAALATMALSLMACDPGPDDPPTDGSGTSGATMDDGSTGDPDDPGDASETDTTESDTDSGAGSTGEGTGTTTGADPTDTGGDGMFACMMSRVFAGNPLGDPGLWPEDGGPMLDMTDGGPNLPARELVFSPTDPTKMVAATGSELWAIDTAAGTVSHILGDRDSADFAAGACDTARIGIVSDLAFRSDGTLFAADHSGNAVVKIEDPFGAGCQMSYYAGTQEAITIGSLPHEPGFVDGPAAQARFAGPDYMTAGPDDTLYVIDTGNSAIRAIDSADEVSTVLEIPGDYVGFSGSATAANSISVIGGKLYLATRGSVQSSQNATILEVDPATGDLREVVTGRDEPWLVGSSSPAIAGVVPVEGSLLVTWVNGRLFTVDVDTSEVTHIAGDGDMPWQSADIPTDYDPFAEHDAFALMLDNLSASTAGASTYMTYQDGALYYSGQAQGYYVQQLDCE